MAFGTPHHLLGLVERGQPGSEERLLLVDLGLPLADLAASMTEVPTSGFNLLAYIAQGDAYNCGNFHSQAEAQAVLKADPRDPNRLDTDRDGIACESNRDPRDLVKVPR